MRKSHSKHRSHKNDPQNNKPKSSNPSPADSFHRFNQPAATPQRSRRNTPPNKKRSNRSKKRRSTQRNRSHSQHSNSTEHRYTPTREERKSINRMCFDIAEAVQGRHDFIRFPPETVALTATIFVRFGVDSFTELKSTRADQRSHFLADAKKPYRFKSMKMAREIFPRAPTAQKGEEHCGA